MMKIKGTLLPIAVTLGTVVVGIPGIAGAQLLCGANFTHSDTDYAPVPLDIQAVDITADGVMDVVMTNEQERLRAHIYSGTDDRGSVTPKLQPIGIPIEGTLPAHKLSRKLAFGDLSGNGQSNDAVIMWRNSPGGGPAGAFILFHHLDPSGNVYYSLEKDVILAGSEPRGVALADLNGDGRDEIIATFSFQSAAMVYDLANETLHLVGFPNYSKGGPIRISDIDNDGHLDVVVGHRDEGRISILKNNGSGELSVAFSALTGITGQWITDIEVIDANGNGLNDIVVAHSAGAIVVALGIGDGTFETPQLLLTGPTIAQLGLSDYNNDQKEDLVIRSNNGNQSIRILHTPIIENEPELHLAFGIPTSPMVLIDFVNDGSKDLVLHGNFFGPGSSALRLWYSEVQCTQSCIGDINGDGIVDAQDLGMLLSGFGTSSAIADLNGDGIVDSEDLGMLLNNWGQC